MNIIQILKFAIIVGGIASISACQRSAPEELREEYRSLKKEISYNTDIRPILSDRCFSCHGPDEKERKANLRLDIRDNAISNLESGNGKAIVPGNISRSLLIDRIMTEDKDFSMPPIESRLSLSKLEKAKLIKWIDEGAEYEDHWSFIKPSMPILPVVPESISVSNEIDLFIGEKLLENDLAQSDRASKERLIRRVTMDVTGLPPSIQEIDNYLNDNSEKAYEKVVDRLLASNSYGERMAMEWMDVSRYADSHGMHADGYRMMWPWRDWVIDAFNKNLSYRDFVFWQIAGDMIPGASFEQKLATAFNRNHTMTAEGGAIDEEFRLSYVFDRTETFSTVFMGLTVACARCHDHKFDPISQKEYYEMSAFFNNVKELGMTGDDGNYGPMLPILDKALEEELSKINEAITQANEDLELSKKEVNAVKDFLDNSSLANAASKIIFHGKIDEISNKKVDQKKNFVARKENPLVDGYRGKAAIFTGEYDELYITDLETFQAYDAFSGSIWINSSKRDSSKTQTLLCTAGEKNDFWRGWELYLDNENRVNVKLIHSLPHNYIHTRTLDSIKINEWNNIAFTYDGTATGKGIQLYINGKKQNTKIEFDHLYKSIHPVSVGKHELVESKPIRVGKSYRNYTGENGVFLGAIDEIKLFEGALTGAEIQKNWKPEIDKFTPELSLELSQEKDVKVVQKKKNLRALIKNKFDLLNDIDEVMVMEEMPEQRESFIYNRGEYTQPRERVYPNTPKVFFDFPEDLPKNRYGLAEWLFSKDHPLTSRVTVNRYWQMIFGTGIVATANDFGLQGSRPSHPELLDYLAVKFMDNDWDVKWLIKEMVMSYTYQQSSKMNPDFMEKDAANKFLARGPSYRLPAEMIRDNALAASGVLVKENGGESVKPYQPEGLWIEKSSFSHILLNYRQDHGDSLYRRSLYTFIRRTSPHPTMTIFDAPNREVCTLKREITSTPLQALVLLNDPQFVEAARIMAERIQEEGGETVQDQIQYAFRLSTGRRATTEEIGILKELYDKQLAHYSVNSKEAKKLISIGDFRVPSHLDEGKTAALTSIASTIINHNESYMKR